MAAKDDLNGNGRDVEHSEAHAGFIRALGNALHRMRDQISELPPVIQKQHFFAAAIEAESVAARLRRDAVAIEEVGVPIRPQAAEIGKVIQLYPAKG